MATINILQLPHEILSHMLTQLPTPLDIVNFGRTCRLAYSIISPSNIALWKQTWLLNFDKPSEAPSLQSLFPFQSDGIKDPSHASNCNWDYYNTLRRWVAALHVLKETWTGTIPSIFISGRDPPDNVADEAEQRLVSTLLEILLHAKPAHTPAELRAGKIPLTDDRYLSLNLQHFPLNFDMTSPLDGLIRGVPRSLRGIKYYNDALPPTTPGSWPDPFRSTSGPTTRSMVRQEWDKAVHPEVASKLHVLAGLTHHEETDTRALGRARRIVYDWDQTDASTGWGPFKKGGSGEIDWRRLEAIVSVVTKQFALTVSGRMTLPQGFCFSIPNRTLPDPTFPEDWAGVTGTWCGTNVFLNWENLLHFNLRAHPAGDHDAFGWAGDLEEGPESCGGLMKLELSLVPELERDAKLRPNLPFDERVKPVYFSGLSKSFDFQMTTAVRGVACLAEDGRAVRWRYIVHYNGTDQWQLEGVQPGGVRSGCVYGLWTSANHEEGGPVGPFMYAPEALSRLTSKNMGCSDLNDCLYFATDFIADDLEKGESVYVVQKLGVIDGTELMYTGSQGWV